MGSARRDPPSGAPELKNQSLCATHVTADIAMVVERRGVARYIDKKLAISSLGVFAFESNHPCLSLALIRLTFSVEKAMFHALRPEL